MKSTGYIPLSKVYIDNEVRKAALKVFDSGEYILGRECRAFEEEFAAYTGTKYAALVGSGTAALWLVLIALGVKSNDEIIVPSLTAFPTIEPILAVGAKPVFVEIGETYTIDCSKISGKVTAKTVGIIPVQLYGHPANMKEITRIAQKHKLFVLEDCCQGHGAKFEGKRVGSLGIAGCFSFYPSKNLTVCGDGGIVTTNNKSIDKEIRMLRDHGRPSKYVHSILGYNERFNEIQASVGRIMLRRLDSFNEHRRMIAALYRKELAGLPIELPLEATWAYHVYHMFVIRLKNRNKLKEFLAKKGIGTGIHYPIPCHQQPVILNRYGKTRLLRAEDYCSQILSLPIHPTLSKKELGYICGNIKQFLVHQGKIL